MKSREGAASRWLALQAMTDSLERAMQRLSSAAPIPIRLDPELEVLAALECGDDERIWRAVRQVADEDRLLRVLAEEVPRMSHRLRSGPYFSELLLVPVIEKASGDVIANRESWIGAEQCLVDALRLWYGGTKELTVFRGVYPYEWLAAWEPSVFRLHLLAAAPRGGGPQPVTFIPGTMTLPKGAPRLGFVLGAIRQRTGWPQLPCPDTLRDTRFRQVVAHSLSGAVDDQAVEVLPPDQVSAALSDGLCLWLTMLHEAVKIAGWGMAPCRAQHDSVDVTLHLGEKGTASVRFLLRRHQVAPVGVECVAALLSGLAPRADGLLQ